MNKSQVNMWLTKIDNTRSKPKIRHHKVCEMALRESLYA